MPLSVLYDLKKRKTRYRVLSADSIVELKTIESMPGGFVLLLVDLHWAKHSDEALEVAYDLLRKGLRYACTWADGEAEGLHDLVDRARIDGGFDTDQGCVMTTWHDDEPLSEAVWYFVNCAFPTAPYDATCRDWIAAVVGEPELSQNLVESLQPMLGLFPKGYKPPPLL